MNQEKVIEKSSYIRIVNKDGNLILARSFIPAGSKIIFEEVEKPESVPWGGTLFNMGVMVRDRVYIGHVVREADDVIVVFADAGGERWDIPKKNIKVVGKNVFCDMDLKDLRPYEVSRDSPLPPSIST
ncbi:MAG: hypothetical protein ACE5J2_02275 [Nitrososphaerales archaeon]